MVFFFFQAEDGIRDTSVTGFRRVLFRSPARALKRRVGDPPVLVASSRRARRELGWTPRHSSLEQMLTDAWGWRRRSEERRVGTAGRYWWEWDDQIECGG